MLGGFPWIQNPVISAIQPKRSNLAICQINGCVESCAQPLGFRFEKAKVGRSTKSDRIDRIQNIAGWQTCDR